MMKEISAWLTGSPSLNLLFLALAIISLFVSFIFYIKGKREKIPVYLAKTFPLVKDNLASVDGLGIFYNGTPIRSLYLTRIAFWNKGKETIHGSDIAASDPLAIISKESNKFLGAKISFARRTSNEITISAEDSKILILFDFLDVSDGVIVDLYHTTPAKISVTGTIKGGNIISQAIDNPDHYSELLVLPYFSWSQKTFNHLPTRKLVFVAGAICLTPVILLASVMDNFARLFRRIPEEYKLTE